MPSGTGWGPYAAHLIQDFEMTSLFVLFLHFYRKAYSRKQKEAALQKESSRVKNDGDLDVATEQSSLASTDTDSDENGSSS